MRGVTYDVDLGQCHLLARFLEGIGYIPTLKGLGTSQNDKYTLAKMINTPPIMLNVPYFTEITNKETI